MFYVKIKNTITSDGLPMQVPLVAAPKIGQIEFQNQQDLPNRSLAFSSVDGRPHPVSESMGLPPCKENFSVKQSFSNDDEGSNGTKPKLRDGNDY